MKNLSPLFHPDFGFTKLFFDSTDPVKQNNRCAVVQSARGSMALSHISSNIIITFKTRNRP